MSEWNNPLEYLAQAYGNEVRYDKNGVPSIFCKFPKMKSSDLNPALPNHTHPAFIVNGVEQDYILLGKYMGNCIDATQTGTIYSMPNMPPVRLGKPDDLLNQCRAFGDGASAMTVADRGFLLLLAQKLGWEPKGNTAFGNFSGDAEALTPPWTKAATAGHKFGYRGWLYECLSTHTITESEDPENMPELWKKLRRIGGMEAYPERHSPASVKNATNYTLNGSGPISWYMGNAFGGICDIIGNYEEMDYGYRVVDGEIQILPNNNAASPNANMSENSTAWRAIRPSGTSEEYTLVAPKSTGTLKWNVSMNKIILDTKTTLSGASVSTKFSEITVNTASIAHVPSIIYELGLLPMPGTTAEGAVNFALKSGEFLVCHGGAFNYPSTSGFGRFSGVLRNSSNNNARLRMMAEPEEFLEDELF